jgi:hypothetical protein
LEPSPVEDDLGGQQAHEAGYNNGLTATGRGLPFYVKDGKDICYIKPDKDFIAFGFGEVVNPAREEGAHMHPVAWTITSLDAATEAKIRALVEKAVA